MIDARHLQDVATLSDAIEAELRAQSLWETAPPSPRALSSPLPFCCDTLRFTQWLQWICLPRTRALVDAGGPLPAHSAIRPMAEEALRGCDWDTDVLLSLIGRFDQAIDRA